MPHRAVGQRADAAGSARSLPSRFFSGTTQGIPPMPSALRSALV